jgi:CTP:molybdopterin cytidylyltransferase MocA
MARPYANASPLTSDQFDPGARMTPNRARDRPTTFSPGPEPSRPQEPRLSISGSKSQTRIRSRPSSSPSRLLPAAGPTGGVRCLAMITGVVLAAGTSSRLGGPGPKQLLELDDRPLVQHAVDTAAAAGLDEIVVVTGHEADVVEAALSLPANARAIRNPSFAEGMAGSLRAGLATADRASEAAVILLADQPGVSADAIRDVVTAFRRSESPFVLARYRDRSGHPIVIGRDAWPLLQELEGDVGAREVIAAHPELVVSVDVDGPVPADVDTWEDYEAVRGDRGRSIGR